MNQVIARVGFGRQSHRSLLDSARRLQQVDRSSALPLHPPRPRPRPEPSNDYTMAKAVTNQSGSPYVQRTSNESLAVMDGEQDAAPIGSYSIGHIPGVLPHSAHSGWQVITRQGDNAVSQPASPVAYHAGSPDRLNRSRWAEWWEQEQAEERAGHAFARVPRRRRSMSKSVRRGESGIGAHVVQPPST